MKKTTLLAIVGCIFFLGISVKLQAQTVVNSLASFRAMVQFSNLNITLAPGNYNLEDLTSGSRVITFSGSNNTITLTGTYIQVPVGCIRESYIVVSGNTNTIIGGEIEDTYRNGLTNITDFSAYNQDRTNLAYGLKGDAVVTVSGTDNLINGLTLTTRGSFPYGYGSMYGIGAGSTFGLDKRCGILINGPRNTLDNIVLHQRAFGHGIYMQGDATETIIKNSKVDGQVRIGAELYNETNTFDLPYRSDYKLPQEGDGTTAIPKDVMFSLSEDAFRAYTGSGSASLDNCSADKMRGGFRFYLGGAATVSNSIATDCGSSNFNLPANVGTITKSSGNFAYAPLSDFAGSKSGYTAEWTIIASPHATGPHNILDVDGNNHKLVLHRTAGPKEITDRAIVVTGSNSTIINETEYNIILESTTSDNTIISCGGGTVTDKGTNNTVIINTNCELATNTCPKTAALMEAECYDAMLGVQTETCSEGGSDVGYINSGDWLKFSSINFSGMKVINARTASKYDGGTIEVRLDNSTGTLIATIPVTNRAGWQTWGTDSAAITSAIDGVHDVYFMFKSSRTGSIFNVNWFSLSASLSRDATTFIDNISIFPNPVTNKLTVSLVNSNLNRSETKIALYTLKGQKVLEVSPKIDGDTTMDLSSLQKGIYILKMTNKSEVMTKKIVKN